jgi:hypothetical protein
MVVHLLIVCNAGKLRTFNKSRLRYHNHLLNTRDVSSNIFNGDGVFDGKTVALAFYSGPVDKDPAIGCESCGFKSLISSLNKWDMPIPTGKSKTNVIIEHDNFANGSRILKLQDRFLLDAQDNYILASNPDLVTS